MTDQLEDLFAELRADTITEVRPPGADAARDTVRRRRRTGHSVVAGAAAALAVAAVGWTTLPNDRRVEPSTSALADTARAAVQESSASFAAGESAGPLTGTVVTTTRVQPGSYLLFVACASSGAGWIDVLVRAETKQLATWRTRCDIAPQSQRIGFTITTGTFASVELRGSPAVDGRAAYAYKMVSEMAKAVPASSSVSKANAATASVLLRAAGGRFAPKAFTTESDSAAFEFHVIGDYLLRLNCVGPGTVTTTVRLEPADVSYYSYAVPATAPVLARLTAHCGASAAATEQAPVRLFAAGRIVLETSIDAEGRNRAGYAYSIDPQ